MKQRLGGLALLATLVASSLAALPVLSARASSFIKGIDVSHWQGSIAWNQVRSAGYKFAFAKATDGASYTDPMYAQNRAGAVRNGIHFGAYHFAEPGGYGWTGIGNNARRQARHYVDVADLKPGNLRPVLDLERNYDIYGGHVLSAKQLIHWTNAWLTTVTKKVGVKPIIYSGASTSGSFWATHTGDTQRFAREGYRLWVPHYTSASTTTVTAGNWAGHGWTFWQWSDGSYPSAPRVPGIAGNVDHDYLQLDSFKSVTIPAPDSGGSGTPSPAPTVSSPPVISGSPNVGNLITSSKGTWTNAPSSYSYAWLRCDQLGQNCASIADAATNRYRVTSRDYGRTLEVLVTASNSGGSATATSQPTSVVGDDTAPTVPGVSVGGGRYTKSTHIDVAWSSSDDASGVASYKVWVQPEVSGTLGQSTPLASNTADTTLVYHGQPGATYCFSARASDSAGNRSAASAPVCTTIPDDDASLVSSGDWGHKTGAALYFRHTFSHSRTKGDKLILSHVSARHIALVATKCRYCGAVKVFFAGKLLKEVDLQSQTKQPSALIRMASFDTAQTGRVVIKVLDGGRSTKIDGIAVSGL